MSEENKGCSCGCCGGEKKEHKAYFRQEPGWEREETLTYTCPDSGCSCGHHEASSCSCGCHEEADDCGCGCGHDHVHGGGENRKELLLCLGAGALLLIAVVVRWGLFSTALMLAAYLLVGFEILHNAFRNICKGRIFDENFLMTVASIGAVCIGETAEAVFVMLLYRLGEYLQGRAVARSRSSIRALMDIRPDHARVVDGDTVREVEAESVPVGSVIEVRPGERIALDGVVLEGVSQLDTAALTGESMPRDCAVGEEVLSGCINLTGLIRVRVTRPFGESAASRILQLVEHAAKNKAVSETFIARFARIYTPIVCLLAVLIALVPGVFGWKSWGDAVYSALCFLVISCPCALVISVPLSFFAGIGCASRNGILVKGGNFLDALARTEAAVFDKTGTLTKGEFGVAEVFCADGIAKENLLHYAALAESGSNHPIARAVTAAGSSGEELYDYREISGYGVSVRCTDGHVLAGKPDWLRVEGVSVPEIDAVGTLVCVALEGQYLGTLVLRDLLKSDAAEAIARLRQLGVTRTVMLSGDSPSAVEHTAMALGIREYFSRLLPEDKLIRIRTLKRELKEKGTLVYTGDGINDTPVLAEADVGVAMGGLGADAAIEAADVVIMGDEPGKLPLAIRIARKTVQIANQNIVFSIAVKVAIMVLSAMGHVELWLAVFADVGVCMLTILNALRINRI